MRPMLCRFIGIVFAALAASAAHAAADKLVILTSFPPSFYEPFRLKFEEIHPDIDVEMIQRSTTSGVAFLQGRPGIPVDLFWVSSPDAFEVLKSNGQLARLHEPNGSKVETVAGYAVDDPEGYYRGFAFSTFGIAYNPDYLEAKRLQLPEHWESLASGAYAGHIGVTTPARSGTSHFMVESILQAYGWEPGWCLLSRLGGNLSTITARSFGVLDGVEQSRFGIGLTIDFLASREEPTASAVQYKALAPLVLAPASVAMLKRSLQRDAARKFIDFLLSESGQEMLLRPEIRRIPVRPTLRTRALAEQGLALDNTKLAKGFVFNASLSALRYEMVNLLFDEIVVHNRQMLRDNWKRINARPESDPGAASAQQAMCAAPISEQQVQELVDNGIMKDATIGSLLNGEQKTVLEGIRAEVRRSLLAAQEILQAGSVDDRR